MGNITFNSLRLSLVILSFADNSQGLYYERLLCENSKTELNCTAGNSINDINITFNDEQNTCRFKIETMIGLDSASYLSCIGNNSCILTDKMINVSHSVTVKMWKLFIKYHCVRTSDQNHNNKTSQTVCPFNMSPVVCRSGLRKIEIQSVELIQYVSYCEKNLIVNKSCTELIHQKVNSSCNGKQKCEPLIWNKSVLTADDCIRIPEVFTISYSCIKAIPTEFPLQDESNVVGVAVSVTVGFIIIVGVVFVYVWFVRRKGTDNKHEIVNRHVKNDDYIGNKNTAMPANYNSEMSQNFELRNYNHTGTNDGRTINDPESSSETRISRQIIRPYSNSAIYSTALEPSDGGCPVHHLNAYNYEMAKPINNSKYDKNTPTLEKDNYAFNEDQYDIARKNDSSGHQQGIYSRGADTVYDSASHSRQNNMSDGTYDHAFGQTTEDDYDIAKH